MKIKTTLIVNVLAAVALGLSVTRVLAVCPPPSWTFLNTCQSCPRRLACIDACDNPPTFGAAAFCGSYDYDIGCRKTVVQQMWCQNCPSDPITTGWWYTDSCTGGLICDPGSDCH